MWRIRFKTTFGMFDDREPREENIFSELHPFVFLKTIQEEYRQRFFDLVSFYKMTDEDVAVAKELGML